MTQFTVYGKPEVWQRARRNGKQYYTHATQEKYQKAVAWSARAARVPLHQGLVAVQILFYLPIPSTVTKKASREALEGAWAPSQKDLDNLAKNHLDALNEVAYVDDRQVVRLTLSKLYSTEPRAVVTITEIGVA